MVLREVRTLIERAEAGRRQLLGLLDVLPRTYWDRVAPGDAWRVHDHAAHVAAADHIVAELLRDAGGSGPLWLGGTTDPKALIALRERRMAAIADQPPDSLLASMAAARAAIVEVLTGLEAALLDLPLFAAGVENEWGQPVPFTVRTYLAQWALHDITHARCIREAVRQPLAPGDILTAARMRP